MLTTSLPHDGDPAAGAFVREMAVALARRGHRVALLGSVPRGRVALRAEGVDVESVHDLDGGVFSGGGAPEALSLGAGPGNPLAWTRAARTVAALAALAARRARGADAWISHFALPSALIAGALRGRRPHLAVLHGSDAWLLARAPTPVRRAVFAAATRWRFTWDGMLPLLQGVRLRAPPVVAPMGFWPAPALDLPRDVVLSVGRLVPVKRVDRALAAVAALRARGVPLPWVVLGDGPERARLELAARAHGVDVRFEGSVDGALRDRWLRRARVLLHTAGSDAGGRGEGAPVAVLEAMGAGAAVVATASGGVASMVGDAGVVLPGDAGVDAIADAVQAAWRAHPSGCDAAVQRAMTWRWEAQAEALERALWG
jgi:glycosyltransferase involved in cell wall biosynthesis